MMAMKCGYGIGGSCRRSHVFNSLARVGRVSVARPISSSYFRDIKNIMFYGNG